jgi:molybdopterin-guanine dinucleotide biosynthesis protein A
LTEENKITGIVLAGGKSTRMGTDKALLIYNGEPLISHAVNLLSLVCNKVVISANDSIYNFTGCENWPDEIPVNAAMVGIYSCLKRSGTFLNLVLSVDMPLISEVFLQKLIEERDGHDLVLPVHDDGIVEPLCGLYTGNLVTSLHEHVISGQFSLRQFAKSSDVKLIQTGDLRSMFFNVNTTKDFGLLNKS